MKCNESFKFYPEAAGTVYQINPKTKEATVIAKPDGDSLLLSDCPHIRFAPKGGERTSISMAFGFTAAEKGTAEERKLDPLSYIAVSGGRNSGGSGMVN